ncbi:hypothetical protein Aple_020870 [Acrocarpospora pleiomorpha]|uniref:Uncharacterized protein n=1 Tax=Acrocarpospora pleiomorpha TaxID=90975 RepID=A0A5M3XHQ2_9ACTN|nr:hypothetical protein [Acrocarpospora pleiomorpha]GES19191.1 hypothetical protein Aple_020870 [Acrocarpospora pleiomorpha]
MSTEIPTTQKTWRPTNKWWAMLVTASGAVAVNWINAGEFDKQIAIALVGVVVQAVATYLLPNQDTPGGVPVKRVR